MLSSAVDTFEDLIFNESHLDDDRALSIWREFLGNLEDFEEFSVLLFELKEIFPNLYLCHKEEFDASYGDFSNKKNSILLTIIEDSNGTSFLLDGNHRLNTFYSLDPNLRVIVRLIRSEVPEDICRYKF